MLWGLLFYMLVTFKGTRSYKQHREREDLLINIKLTRNLNGANVVTTKYLRYPVQGNGNNYLKHTRYKHGYDDANYAHGYVLINIELTRNINDTNVVATKNQRHPIQRHSNNFLREDEDYSDDYIPCKRGESYLSDCVQCNCQGDGTFYRCQSLNCRAHKYIKCKSKSKLFRLEGGCYLCHCVSEGVEVLECILMTECFRIPNEARGRRDVALMKWIMKEYIKKEEDPTDPPPDLVESDEDDRPDPADERKAVKCLVGLTMIHDSKNSCRVCSCFDKGWQCLERNVPCDFTLSFGHTECIKPGDTHMLAFNKMCYVCRCNAGSLLCKFTEEGMKNPKCNIPAEGEKVKPEA